MVESAPTKKLKDFGSTSPGSLGICTRLVCTLAIVRVCGQSPAAMASSPSLRSEPLWIADDFDLVSLIHQIPDRTASCVERRYEDVTVLHPRTAEKCGPQWVHAAYHHMDMMRFRCWSALNADRCKGAGQCREPLVNCPEAGRGGHRLVPCPSGDEFPAHSAEPLHPSFCCSSVGHVLDGPTNGP